MALTDLIDQTDAGLICPACSKSVPATLADLDAQDHLVCSGCGARINLEKSGFTQEFSNARTSMAEFDSLMNNLFK